MTAIFDGQFAKMKKKKKSFLENCSDTILYRIHSEGLENGHFHALFSVTAAVGHLKFPSRINLKGLHLHIILIELIENMLSISSDIDI